MSELKVFWGCVSFGHFTGAGDGRHFGVVDWAGLGLPGGKFLSLVLPRERNQRECDPAATVLRTSLRCSPSRAADGNSLSLKQPSTEIPRLGCAARRGTVGES